MRIGFKRVCSQLNHDLGHLDITSYGRQVEHRPSIIVFRFDHFAPMQGKFFGKGGVGFGESQCGQPMIEMIALFEIGGFPLFFRYLCRFSVRTMPISCRNMEGGLFRN